MSFVKGYTENSSFESVHGKEKSLKLSKEDALKRMENEKPKVELYKKLCNKVLIGNKENIYNEEYYKLVTELLEWNQELYTVWNYRKKLIINYLFSNIKNDDYDQKHLILENELMFTLKKLKKSPKSYWIWNHRIWCLKLDKLSNWKFEIELIDTFLKSDSRNFHVWSYRRFIVEHMKDNNNNELIDFNEFKFTTKMINKDISNYSAWHNRSQLIVKLFNKSPIIINKENDENSVEYLKIFNNKDKRSFLIKELNLVKTAIYTDPDDSSVWFYIKWLISDYFINDLNDNIIEIINNVINDIEELNDVEFSDNGIDNKWCLISIVYLLKQLYKVQNEIDTEKFYNILKKLEKLDPMRIERYKEFQFDN